MNQPIHGEKKNKVLLKPRFKMEFDQSSEIILRKFKENLESGDCKYCSKQSGNIIFMDVPKIEEHFWSPQLQIEVIEEVHNKTIVKGIIGPKPQIWTMFMFFHFAIAAAFIVFFVMFYVKWSMDKDYQLYKYMLLILPFLSISLYFIGQAGKKIAYKQMLELDNFLMSILNK
jgi:ABC-type multidrug transport system fused ATPase/permease subunit